MLRVSPLPSNPASLDAELGELRGHVAPVARWRDLAVHVENPAVTPDVERPADGGRFGISRDAICQRRAPVRIAEERIINAQRLRELPVLLQWIDAGGEERDIECSDLIGALTERPALRRSTRAERAREPRQNNRLFSTVVTEPIGASVGAGQLEIRCGIAELEHAWGDAWSALPGDQRRRPGEGQNSQPDCDLSHDQDLAADGNLRRSSGCQHREYRTFRSAAELASIAAGRGAVFAPLRVKHEKSGSRDVPRGCLGSTRFAVADQIAVALSGLPAEQDS